MRKYDKIMRLGKEETEGILEGTVYIQEKIDGANCSVYYDSLLQEIVICSHSREIARIGESKEKILYEFRGLIDYIKNHSNIINMIKQGTDYIFYGEWLVKHTVAYPEELYQQVYFFDIYNKITHEYTDLELAIEVFEKYGVKYLPIMATLRHPQIDDVKKYLTVNTFKGTPQQEGIVIKRAGYVNKFGRTQWAKIVNEKFQERKKEVWKRGKKNEPVEGKIALTYTTRARVEKIMEKMFDGTAPVNERRLGELLQRVYHDIITEEAWTFIKKHGNPTIDFRALKKEIDLEVKRIFFNLLEGRVSN